MALECVSLEMLNRGRNSTMMLLLLFAFMVDNQWIQSYPRLAQCIRLDLYGVRLFPSVNTMSGLYLSTDKVDRALLMRDESPAHGKHWGIFLKDLTLSVFQVLALSSHRPDCWGAHLCSVEAAGSGSWILRAPRSCFGLTGPILSRLPLATSFYLRSSE